jgi:SAM-dependent methyltransferase
LLATGGFAARVRALDALELRSLEREPAAEALRERLERANARTVGGLRRRVRAGRAGPGALRRGLAGLVRSVPPAAADLVLDRLVAGLLDVGPPADPCVALGPDMVPYQPTPARVVLDMVDRVVSRRDDVFCDLGSGLGHVVVLVALLAGVRARGVEIEPAYVEHARRCAQELGVQAVDFLCADARDAPLEGVGVFFLYTPFRGAVLREVLAAVARESARRAITVCTFGRCTAEVEARAPWLVREDGDDVGAAGAEGVAVFHGRRLASSASVPLY